MRKLVFSALACVAFAGSSLASNEIVVDITTYEKEVSEINLKSEITATIDSFETINSDETRPCSWKALVLGLDGNWTIKEGSTEGNVTKDGCKQAADGWAAATHQITPIMEGTMDIVWGDRL